MAEIVNVFKQEIPAMRFIGKKYPKFANWGEWFANGWFDEIEKAMGGVDNIVSIWENGGGYVGLELNGEGVPFEYWIGMFTPAGTPVPDGFSHIDFDKRNLGICWIRMKANERRDRIGYNLALENKGFEIKPEESGGVYSFENGLCPRFTTPDENGLVILDYCHFVV